MTTSVRIATDFVQGPDKKLRIRQVNVKDENEVYQEHVAEAGGYSPRYEFPQCLCVHSGARIIIEEVDAVEARPSKDGEQVKEDTHVRPSAPPQFGNVGAPAIDVKVARVRDLEQQESRLKKELAELEERERATPDAKRKEELAGQIARTRNELEGLADAKAAAEDEAAEAEEKRKEADANKAWGAGQPPAGKLGGAEPVGTGTQESERVTNERSKEALGEGAGNPTDDDHQFGENDPPLKERK